MQQPWDNVHLPSSVYRWAVWAYTLAVVPRGVHLGVRDQCTPFDIFVCRNHCDGHQHANWDRMMSLLSRQNNMILQ